MRSFQQPSPTAIRSTKDPQLVDATSLIRILEEHSIFLIDVDKAIRSLVNAGTPVPGPAGPPSPPPALTNFLYLPGIPTGQVLLTVAGEIPFTIRDRIASSSAVPNTNALFLINTLDLVDVFRVAGDGVTTISAPYTTYTSGNPILLTLLMDDATTNHNTILRVRTRNATSLGDRFTVSHSGAVNIAVGVDHVGLTITGFSTQNLLTLNNPTPTPVLTVGVGGVTVIAPSTNSGVALTVRRTSGTTADIQQWTSSAAVGLTKVVAGGGLHVRYDQGQTLTGSLSTSFSTGGSAALTTVQSNTVGWNGAAVTNGLWRLEPTLSDPGGVGVPGVPSTTAFRLSMTASDLAESIIGLQVNQTISDDPGYSGGACGAQALDFNVNSAGSGGIGSLAGVSGITLHASTGACGSMFGLRGVVRGQTGAGTIALAKSVIADCLTNANITEFYSLYVGMPSVTGGAVVSTGYGIFIEYKATGITNGWSIVAGSAAGGFPSMHAGNFFFGSVLTTPTAKIHVAAGTTAASTAPIKLTTGTSMTTAEVGAIEYTTDDLFFTISTGTARKRFLFADPTGGLTSGRVPFATTNGRLTDDADMTFSTDRLTVTKITTTLATLTASAAPGSPATGDVWDDSTQKSIQHYCNGVKENLSSVLFTQTASATNSTTGQVTLISTGVGTVTLPANFLVVGKTLRITARGHWDTGNNPAETIRFRLKYGSTVIQDTNGAGNLTPALAVGTWEFSAIVTCRTTGATGTVMTQGWVEWTTSTQSAVTRQCTRNTGTTTIDTTASTALDLTSEWTNPTGGTTTMTCTNLMVEVLN